MANKGFNVDDGSEIVMKKYSIQYETISHHEVTVEVDEDFFNDTTLPQGDVPECDGSCKPSEECLPIAIYDENGEQIWTV